MFSPIGSLINLIIGFIELLLSLRFIFKFFEISRSSFTNWLYSFTQPLVDPFIGILPNFNLGIFLIETPTLIAILVFLLIGYFIGAIFTTPTHHYHDY